MEFSHFSLSTLCYLIYLCDCDFILLYFSLSKRITVSHVLRYYVKKSAVQIKLVLCTLR